MGGGGGDKEGGYCRGRLVRAGTSILEIGGQKTAFECSFQCFSYKCFVKFSRKGGEGTTLQAPPLNLCMYCTLSRC